MPFKKEHCFAVVLGKRDNKVILVVEGCETENMAIDWSLLNGPLSFHTAFFQHCVVDRMSHAEKKVCFPYWHLGALLYITR